MEKKYAVIERAYLMCPHMIMGVKFHIDWAYNENKLRQTIDKLAEVHPFLCCTISEDDKGMYYDDSGESLTEIIINEESDDYNNDYKEVSDKEWNAFKEGLLKVFAYKKKKGFDLLFVINHMLCDGRGAMQLVKDFVSIYSGNEIDGEKEPQLISSLSDLPDGCEIKGINKFILDRVISGWRKENRKVSYDDYELFFKAFVKDNPVKYKTMTVDKLKMNVIAHKCQQYNISVNSVLVSSFISATGIKKAGVAADMRGRLSVYKNGTMGNYATTFSLSSPSKKLYECYEMARDVEEKVSEKLRDNSNLFMDISYILSMDGSLIDSMFISSFGGFNSRSGKAAGKIFGFNKQKGLGIMNLGKYEIEGVDDVVFIAPAAPMNEQTIGVVTVNGKMNICDSFYSNLKKMEDISNMFEEIYKCL